MAAAVEAQLAKYPTTAEEDEALLAASGDGDMTPRMEMCVRYRLLQKQNVEAFKRFLDEVVTPAAAAAA